MNNSKLIIITEYSSLKTVNDNVKSFQGFNSLENSGFLKLDYGIDDEKKYCVKLVEALTLNDAEIVFVWDRNAESKPDEWWNTIFLPLKKAEEKWYVAKHTKGIKPQTDIANLVFCREGAHISGNAVYGTIADILLDTASNKKERIIDRVFKLELALEFLHGCLEKQPDTADFQKLKDVGIDISALQLENGKPFDTKYIESLRDKLLELVS